MPGVPPLRTQTPRSLSRPGKIAEAMSCLQKSRGPWGPCPQRRREGGEAASTKSSPIPGVPPDGQPHESARDFRWDTSGDGWREPCVPRLFHGGGKYGDEINRRSINPRIFRSLPSDFPEANSEITRNYRSKWPPTPVPQPLEIKALKFSGGVCLLVGRGLFEGVKGGRGRDELEGRNAKRRWSGGEKRGPGRERVGKERLEGEAA